MYPYDPQAWDRLRGSSGAGKLVRHRWGFALMLDSCSLGMLIADCSLILGRVRYPAYRRSEPGHELARHGPHGHGQLTDLQRWDPWAPRRAFHTGRPVAQARAPAGLAGVACMHVAQVRRCKYVDRTRAAMHSAI